jgi:hypothetical protein
MTHTTVTASRGGKHPSGASAKSAAVTSTRKESLFLADAAQPYYGQKEKQIEPAGCPRRLCRTNNIQSLYFLFSLLSRISHLTIWVFI